MLEKQANNQQISGGDSGVSKITPGWLLGKIPENDNLWEVSPIVGFNAMQVLTNKALQIPDVGQAILNAQNTANTRLTLQFTWEGDQSEEEASKLYNEATAMLHDWKDKVYPGSNIQGLIDEMIASAMTTGAMCVEWVMEPGYRGVKKAVLAHTPTLRWVSDDKMNLKLYQLAPVLSMAELGSKQRQSWQNRWIPLVTSNIVYRAVCRVQGNPYGIPPIVTLLRVLPAHELAYNNITKTLSKYGIMGFLIVNFVKPKRQANESDASYESRLITNLDRYFDQYKDMFREGVAVGYKDESEIEIKDVTGNTSGIADIVQLIEEQMMSALNQDPALAGRTYSTTETYAGVVYDKYLRGMNRLQSCAADIMERGIFLHLAGNGLPIKGVKVSFEQAKSLTNKVDAEANFMNQKVCHALYEDGIYDQNQYANKIGEDRPAMNEPRYPYVSDVESQAELTPAATPTTQPKRNKNGERQTRGDKEIGAKKTEPRRYR